MAIEIFNFEISPILTENNHIAIYVGPERAYAGFLSSLVSAVRGIVRAVVSVANYVIGGVLSTVGGIFGSPKLGCRVVGTNGFAELYNNKCGAGSEQVDLTGSTQAVNSQAICDIGGKVFNTSCAICENGQTATLKSLCPPFVKIQFVQ